MSTRIGVALLVSLLWFPLEASTRAFAEKQAAELLPPTTVAYAEVAEPNTLLDVLLDHPLRERSESLAEYRAALQSGEFQQFRAIVAEMERQIGLSWRQALETLTADGVFAAVDAKTQGVVLLVKSRDAATIEKTCDALLQMVRDDAQRKGKGNSIHSAEYRGITAYRANNARFATFGPWLLLTNKDALGRDILDSYLDAEHDSFADDEHFQSARASLSGSPSAWGFANLAVLRGAGFAKPLYEKSDNPVIELVLGGVLGMLGKAPYATAALHVQRQQARLILSTPFDTDWIAPEREYYFGGAGQGSAPAALRPQRTLLSIGAYRDLGGMWLVKDDLFKENIAAQLTQADSSLSTLFSGRDFGQDILGSVRPELQIVAVRQTYDDLATPQPEIKLPAGALVFQLKEPEKMRRELKVVFQSLIGFLNIVGAQQGQPPLDLNTEMLGDNLVVSTAYLPDNGQGRINYNFSPTIAFVGDRLVVASTSQLAKEIVSLIAHGDRDGAGQGSEGPNTYARLDVQVLRDAIQDNRQHLVARNMLEKGHDKDQAELEISRLLDILGVGRSLSLQLSAPEKRLQLEFVLTIDPSE